MQVTLDSPKYPPLSPSLSPPLHGLTPLLGYGDSFGNSPTNVAKAYPLQPRGSGQQTDKQWQLRRWKNGLLALTLALINGGVLALAVYLYRYRLAVPKSTITHYTLFNSAINAAGSLLGLAIGAALSAALDASFLSRLTTTGVTPRQISFHNGLATNSWVRKGAKPALITAAFCLLFSQYGNAIVTTLGVHQYDYPISFFLHGPDINQMPSSPTIWDSIVANPDRIGNMFNNLEQAGLAAQFNMSFPNITMKITDSSTLQYSDGSFLVSTLELQKLLYQVGTAFDSGRANWTDKWTESALNAATGGITSASFTTLLAWSNTKCNAMEISSQQTALEANLNQYSVQTDYCGTVYPIYANQATSTANYWACWNDAGDQMYSYVHIRDSGSELLYECSTSTSTGFTEVQYDPFNLVVYASNLSSINTPLAIGTSRYVTQVANTAFGYHCGHYGSTEVYNLFIYGQQWLELGVSIIVNLAVMELQSATIFYGGVSDADYKSASITINVSAFGTSGTAADWVGVIILMQLLLFWITYTSFRHRTGNVSLREPVSLLAIAINSDPIVQFDGSCSGTLSKGQQNIKLFLNDTTGSHLELQAYRGNPPKEGNLYGWV